MKNFKILFLSVVAAGLTLTSCNKDDDKNNASIEGKWTFSQEGLSQGNNEVLSNYEHAEGCNKDFVEFIEGGSYKDVSYFGSDCTVTTETGTWSRNGNTLTATIDGETNSAEIVNLTDNELKLRVSEVIEGQTFNYVTVFTR